MQAIWIVYTNEFGGDIDLAGAYTSLHAAEEVRNDIKNDPDDPMDAYIERTHIYK